VYFFNTLLQKVDRQADLDNSDAVDQLCVVCIMMVTEMTVDEAFKVLSVWNKLLGIQNRTLWYLTADLMSALLE